MPSNMDVKVKIMNFLLIYNKDMSLLKQVTLSETHNDGVIPYVPGI